MITGLDKNIAYSDKAIEKIEALSTQYHFAGLHVKNMTRIAIGKEIEQKAKPVGVVAKAFEAPYKTERNIYISMKNGIEAAIGSITRLQEKAAERKPSIKETLETLNKKVEREKAERPAPQRTLTIEHSR